MKIEKIIIRLDAGGKFGLGHLSRCISLINEFKCNINEFIIKTDNQQLVEDYIKNNLSVAFKLMSIDQSISQSEEIDVISSHYTSNTLLIVDHYSAVEDYQKQLFDKKIKWLQLDSHAKINFYANWVMHGSPGATDSLYEPLRKNANTKFLLGPKYCIIKEQLRNRHQERRVRTKLQNVIVCFGGGNDKGATLACLKALDYERFQNIEFTVAMSQFNPDYTEILKLQDRGRIHVINPSNLLETMIQSDLALITPGMISYESAFLGLPMLLVTIADNQAINAKAWGETKCGLNIGSVFDVSKNLNKNLSSLEQNLEILPKMSQNCLSLVDGKGVSRIVNEIMN